MGKKDSVLIRICYFDRIGLSPVFLIVDCVDDYFIDVYITSKLVFFLKKTISKENIPNRNKIGIK